jgi:hypothetical protein
MQQIPLAAIPNQTFTVTLDGNFYALTFKFANGIMTCTIYINDVLVLSNVRVVAGFPIIPYEYLENGNFVILTENEEYPDYTQFGITQQLIYASAAELGALRGGT